MTIAAACLSSVSMYAQTAAEIVTKHIDAMGGKDVISKINSLYMEGSLQAMGNESPTTITVLNGKGYKSESDFNGGKIIQCVNDKNGWSMNPMSGGAAQAMPDEAYKSAREQINIGGALYNYVEKGSTISLDGKEGSSYKIKLVSKDKDETTYYIDAATYYISKLVKKAEVMGQPAEITLQFTDYKKTDQGFPVPYTINTDLGQFQLVTNIKKVEVNKPVDPAVFNIPK